MQTKRLYIIEDNIKNWIGTNRVQWYTVLFILGVSLVFLFNYLLGGGLGTIVIRNSVGFGLLLMFIEYVAGGSGIE